MKGALVAESQLEILRVGGIEKPESYEASRDSSDRSDRSVHNDGVASGAVGDIESAESFVVVFNRSIGVELAVLQDKRQVVHAERPRQPKPRVGTVVDDDHPRQPHVDLPGGIAMRMGMEPKRRGGLIDLQHRPPTFAWAE